MYFTTHVITKYVSRIFFNMSENTIIIANHKMKVLVLQVVIISDYVTDWMKVVRAVNENNVKSYDHRDIAHV